MKKKLLKNFTAKNQSVFLWLNRKAIALQFIMGIMSLTPLQAQSNLSQQKAPLFIENKGQIADVDGHVQNDILYTASIGNTMQVYFRKNGFSYVVNSLHATHQLSSPEKEGIAKSKSIPDTLCRIDVELLGANLGVQITTEEPTAEFFNYYYAHCPNGITHVKAYHKLVYKDIYPHIDMHIFFPDTSPEGESGQGMLYDYVVNPGGDPSVIQVKYTGAQALSLESAAELRITTPVGIIRESVPVIYQTPNYTAKHSMVSSQALAGGLLLQHNTISYAIPAYNRTQTLVIDPWVTYLGGTVREDLVDENHSMKVATDAANNVFITGTTASADFPITIGVFVGYFDIFVSKFNASGTMQWSTLIGGTNDNGVNDIAVSNTLGGRVTIVGATLSNNFPTGATAGNTCFQPNIVKNGGAIIAQFALASGIRNWSTYYGGNSANPLWDEAFGVAVDPTGNIFITGYCNSDGLYPFPLSGLITGDGTPCQTAQTAKEAFLLKFDPTGKRWWATLLGGNGADYGFAVATDANGNAFVTGRTTSTDFPGTAGRYQINNGGGADVFVAKYDNSNGACGLLWATYIGGPSDEGGYGIATDAAGNALLCGYTRGNGFPATAPLTSTIAGGAAPNNYDGFITKLNGGTSNVIWSTYYGGNLKDIARDIAVNANGDAVVIGSTTSTANVPITANAIQSTNKGNEDIFLTVRNGTTGDTICATYYGGTGNDRASGVTVDGLGNILMCGITNSDFFPGVTASSYQPNRKGDYDAFVGQLCSRCGFNPNVKIVGRPGKILYPKDTVKICYGDTVILKAGFYLGNIIKFAIAGATYAWNTGAIIDSIIVHPTITTSYEVDVAMGSCGMKDTVTVVVVRPKLPTLAGKTTLCTGKKDTLIITTNVISPKFEWYKDTLAAPISTNDSLFTGTLSPAASYTYYVRVDSAGCKGPYAKITVKVNDCVVVPLDLLSFTGKGQGAINLLTWVTANEINNDYFTIERATNPLPQGGGQEGAFTPIGRVKGAGNSEVSLNYSYIDSAPINGLSYYRLKQTDFDGKYLYSPVISLIRNAKNQGLLTISPNPVLLGESVAISYMLSEAGTIHLKIMNALGVEVFENTGHYTAGNNIINIPTDALSQGFYFLQVSFGDNTEIRKLVVK